MEISKITYNEPEKVFIVPYRDRERHLELFLNHMKHVLEDENYLILIIHQNDKRHFNRGAMKNIGFLYVRKIFPKTYKNKKLIFHDVDHVVWKKGILDFDTKKGIVKHHFGFPKNVVKSLGGIFTICAGDFEMINGFPNYWGWGYEDNCLYNRVENANLTVDCSNFKHIKHKDIIMFWHGQKKLTNESYIWKKFEDDDNIGLHQISNLLVNPTKYQNRENVIMVNVNNFAVPGIYPELIKKIPSVSFKQTTTINNYKNLFNRKN